MSSRTPLGQNNLTKRVHLFRGFMTILMIFMTHSLHYDTLAYTKCMVLFETPPPQTTWL